MAGQVYTLASLAITTALTASAQTAIDDLDGMMAVSLEASWSGGSGGTSVTATVATTFDGGTTWREIARFDFTTAAAVKHANLSGLLSKGVTSYATLSADSVNDGVLGTQLRVSVGSIGVFTGAGGVLSVRAAVR